MVRRFLYELGVVMVTRVAVYAFDYAFAENGLTAYKMGKQLPSQSFIKWVGEEKYKKLVNFILHYLADIEVPVKRYCRILIFSRGPLLKRSTAARLLNSATV